MRSIEIVVSLMVVAGCGGARPAAAPPEREDLLAEQHDVRSDRDAPRHEPAELKRPIVVRFHMQRHFEDLRAIERLLVAGKLDDARTHAYLLTRPAADPGLAAWQVESSHVVDAALALTAARSLDEACRREPLVLAACASCHIRAQRSPAFEVAPPAPPDRATSEARMARHQWAVDRLWEGMIGTSDTGWRAGLEVLAGTPLPATASLGAPGLAARLQDLARTQLAIRATTTLEARAAAYGELLVTCAGCHAALNVPRR